MKKEIFKNIHKSNVKLDYLVVRIDKNLIDSRFFWCVENSPILKTIDIFWLDTYIFFEQDYNTHKIFYIKDKKWNSLCQIMIVNDLLNKRQDFYDKITFYWTFFNLYEFYENIFVSNVLAFFWCSDNSRITRFDLKTDINIIPYFKKDYLQKIKTQNQTWFCYSNKTKNSKSTFEFRIYDKKLDILDKELYKIEDNFWGFPYKEEFDKNDILRRIEIQYNSKKIKEKNIKLKDLFDYDFLYNEMQNYTFQFLKNSWITKKIYHKIWDKKEKISFQKKENILNHTQIMLEAYIEKMYFLDFNRLEKIILSKSWLKTDFILWDLITHKNRILMQKENIKELENKIKKLENELRKYKK